MNHLVSRVAAAGAVAAVLTGGAAAVSPAATASPATTAVTAARNPIYPPTTNNPGSCRKVQTVTINGRRIIKSNLGGGNPLPAKTIVKSLRKAGFTRAQLPRAISVMIGESAMCPHARHNNPDWGTGRITSTDFGLYQVNTRWHPWAKRYNLDSSLDSAKVAYRISKRGTDWSPWHASRTSDRFLPQARAVIAEAARAGVR